MEYEVRVADVGPRPTVVVAATTSWSEFPALWGPLTGRVAASALPGGTVATTVHHGSFADLGPAHDAVLGWCRAHGRRPAGARWEIYGPHHEDPARQRTEVSWLLA